MKLDKEQVELINSFLVKNDVLFDDIRYEIIDHIACDVEENYAEVPFPDAIKKVLKKWESQIQMSNSLWVISWSNFPRIITNKLKQLFVPQIYVFLLILLISQIINLKFPQIVDNFMTYLKSFQIFYIIWFLCISILGIKIFFTKAHTTYKYIFKRNFYMVYLFTVLLFFGYINGIVSLTYLFVNLSFTVFFIQNYREHFKFLKKI